MQGSKPQYFTHKSLCPQLDVWSQTDAASQRFAAKVTARDAIRLTNRVVGVLKCGATYLPSPLPEGAFSLGTRSVGMVRRAL